MNDFHSGRPRESVQNVASGVAVARRSRRPPLLRISTSAAAAAGSPVATVSAIVENQRMPYWTTERPRLLRPPLGRPKGQSRRGALRVTAFASPYVGRVRVGGR